MRLKLVLAGFLFVLTANAQQGNNYVKENYTKIDTTITMRDGIKLYTIIYIPQQSG